MATWPRGTHGPGGACRRLETIKAGMALLLVLVSLVIWSGGIAAAQAVSPPPATQGETRAGLSSPAAATPTARITPEGVFARASALRRLTVKESVPLGFLSKDELRDHLIQSMEEEQSREDLDTDKATLVLLDLLKEEDDLYEIYLDLMTEQVAGFYELDARQMKLVEPASELSVFDELSLAHEYVHALQDQNFDLGANLKAGRRDAEKALALRALSEGDATLAMLLYARQNMTAEQLADLGSGSGQASQEKLQSAPLILRLSLLFPYQQGVAFATAVYLTGGWGAVDRAYARPPETSEQILHPQKYLAWEGPVPVALPDVAGLGPGWSVWKEDTLGELGAMAYLAMGIPAEEAVAAAEGWGGDRILLLRDAEGAPALVVATAWDSEEDAMEFFDAVYYRHADADGTTVDDLDRDRFTWTGPTHRGYASLNGDRVLLVVSLDEATTGAVAKVFDGTF